MARKRVPKWLRAARAGATGDWLSRALGRVPVIEDGRVVEAIEAGRVAVDGVVLRDPFAPVSRDSAVTVDDVPVSLAWETIVVAFHKPRGVVVAGHDPEGRGTVFEALRDALGAPLRHVAWHAAGRLDRETTGLLLFTNDERFVEHATRPEAHLPKRYVAHVDGRITEEALRRLREGIEIEGVLTLPALAGVREAGVVELTIREGRHHQVRRMLAAVRLGVRVLHREAIGTLVLDVPEGAARLLTASEVRESLGYPPS